MDKINRRIEKPHRIRTRPFTYAIFGVLIGPIVIAWIYIARSSPGASNRDGALVAGGLLAAVWLWFFLLEVDLYSDRIVFKTLLRKREVAYSDIRKVDIFVRRSRGATGYGWAISDTMRFARRPLEIPISPFRDRDQRKIAKMLVEKAVAARIDPWTCSIARLENNPL
jgi:hypothetical protein